MRIRISNCSETKPDTILTDSNGINIKPGYKVAYNRSGVVVIGTIIELVRSEWVIVRQGPGVSKWWSLRFTLIVEDATGKRSTITNPNSFIIL